MRNGIYCTYPDFVLERRALMPGPHPKRSAERRRRNIVPGETTVVREGMVRSPRLPPGMDPIAVRWFNSLRSSGQSDFFEPSDWAAAVFVAEVITRALEEEAMSAALFAGIWSAMGDLMTTESARRRMRLEVERRANGDAEPEKPTALDDYKTRLEGAR